MKDDCLWNLRRTTALGRAISNASIIRCVLQSSSNDFNVDAPIRLQTGDQFWSSLLASALIGLRHRSFAVRSSRRNLVCGNPRGLRQVGLDRFGASRRQIHVVGPRSDPGGVPRDHDDFKLGTLQLCSKVIERLLASGPHSVLPEVKQRVCRETHPGPYGGRRRGWWWRRRRRRSRGWGNELARNHRRGRRRAATFIHGPHRIKVDVAFVADGIVDSIALRLDAYADGSSEIVFGTESEFVVSRTFLGRGIDHGD